MDYGNKWNKCSLIFALRCRSENFENLFGSGGDQMNEPWMKEGEQESDIVKG